MASNQYRQPPPHHAPPDQGYYRQESGRGGWQQTATDREGYDGHNKPNSKAYQDPYIGQKGYHQEQQYAQEEYWEDHQYQESYQEPYRENGNGNGNGDGYYSGQQYEQRPPPQTSRSYQYDERFHNQGVGRGQHPTIRGPDRVRSPQDRHRPVNLQLEKKPKPRERILTAPASPKEISWDNPFPTFGPTKKKDKKKHTSLDKGMGKLDLGGRAYPSVARPNTSQSSRRREESRPHTSQAQNPPVAEFANSPPLHQLQQAPMSPLRKENPNRRPVAPSEETYGGDDPSQRYQRPGVSPLNPMVSGQQSASFRGQGSQMSQPPRSMTAPGTPITADYQASSQQLPSRGKSSQEPPKSSGYNGLSNEYSDPNTESAYAAPKTSRPRPEGMNFQTSGQGFQPTETDMPNFDAIPRSASEREDALVQDNRRQAIEQPAYQKKTYQAPTAYQPQPESSKTQNRGYGNDPQLPLNDFAFKIPSQNQAPAEQYPPRGASRPEPQPRSAIDAQQYPPTSNQRSQQGRPDRGEQIRPSPSQGSHGQGQPYEQGFDTNDYAQGYEYEQQAANQGGGNRGIQQYPPRSNDVQRQYSHSPPQSGVYNGMQSMSAARPPPVRHYGDRTSSDKVQKQHGRQPSFGSQAGPDALPAHPVPFRPGLTNNQVLPRADTPQAQVPPAQRRVPPPQAAVPTKPPVELPVTKEELNILQQRVKAVPQDSATALKLAKKLVQAAKILSNEGGRADAKTAAKNRERYIFDAHKIVKKLVSVGYPDAMFYLADCHGQGLLGLAPDPKEAFQLYQSAAKLGHPQSAYRVAVCCEMGAEDGGGTRRDPAKAIQWYKRAATLGDTPAMYKMGMILLKGLLGQPKNPREALSWLKRAAERANEDSPHALHELGLLYENARPEDHIIKDQAYALQLFTQAAELNYKYSQFRLGVAYEYGLLGCPIDPRQSIAWYSKAAAQGEHQSELALSGWYLTGSEPILKQSDTEAFLWARKAASGGLAKAEFAMGYYTEVGIGGTANLEEAKRWYWKAAAQEDPRARKRLEEMKQGGGRMKKERVSRSAVNHGEGECVVM